MDRTGTHAGQWSFISAACGSSNWRQLQMPLPGCGAHPIPGSPHLSLLALLTKCPGPGAKPPACTVLGQWTGAHWVVLCRARKSLNITGEVREPHELQESRAPRAPKAKDLQDVNPSTHCRKPILQQQRQDPRSVSRSPQLPRQQPFQAAWELGPFSGLITASFRKTSCPLPLPVQSLK